MIFTRKNLKKRKNVAFYGDTGFSGPESQSKNRKGFVMKRNMRICTLALVFLALAAAVGAAERQSEQMKEEQGKSRPWEFLQLGVWYGVGSNQNEADVYGFRIGLPVCGGDTDVSGIELGVLGAASTQVNGLQLAPFATIAKKINGLSLGIANLADKVNGVQIGIVNVAKERSVQIGLVNWISDSCLPFFPFINVKF